MIINLTSAHSHATSARYKRVESIMIVTLEACRCENDLPKVVTQQCNNHQPGDRLNGAAPAKCCRRVVSFGVMAAAEAAAGRMRSP